MTCDTSNKETVAPRMKNAGDADTFPRPLAEDLWVLGNSYFSLYLVKGEQASALIEVGVSAIVDEVVRQLESLETNPTFLVVTHPHFDHLTGLEGLKERYPDALVVAGAGAPEFLEHPKVQAGVAPEEKHISEYMASIGTPAGRPPLEDAPSLADCLIASDGDEMDLGGLTLRFLAVKGHAPGHINVYVPEREALIASDSLGYPVAKRGICPLFFMSFEDHVRTLDRLEQFNPRILGLGHQGARTGSQVQESFAEARKTAFEMREKIRNDPRDVEEISRDLFEEFYQDEFLIFNPQNISLGFKSMVKQAKK
jgi:glyoxylase-like metal-dependent hydrolase (beta-lactamase superfamily II)